MLVLLHWEWVSGTRDECSVWCWNFRQTLDFTLWYKQWLFMLVLNLVFYVLVCGVPMVGCLGLFEGKGCKSVTPSRRAVQVF